MQFDFINKYTVCRKMIRQKQQQLFRVYIGCLNLERLQQLIM